MAAARSPRAPRAAERPAAAADDVIPSRLNTSAAMTSQHFPPARPAKQAVTRAKNAPQDGRRLTTGKSADKVTSHFPLPAATRARVPFVRALAVKTVSDEQ